MKQSMQNLNRTVTAAVLMAVISLAAGCSGSGSSTGGVIDPVSGDVIGSGVMAEESRPVGGMNGFDMGGEGTVYLHQGATNSLTIRAEDNLLPYILTDVRSGRLEIRTMPGYDLRPTRAIEYHLTVTSLDHAELSGAGSIQGTVPAGNSLTVVLEGAGNIDLDGLDFTSLDVTRSGVGELWLSGDTDRQTVYLSGVGNYEAENLASRECDVTVTGHGSATVRVSDRLDATITGIGSVYYYGDPTVSSHVTGSGSVVRMGS